MGKTISERGIKLLKQFEGCRLKAYKAITTETYYTIGYGHYGADVKAGMTITQAQADAYLKTDLKRFEDAVNNYVKVDITQNMFDALVSFTYNCGAGALKGSTLLKKLNTKDYVGAAEEFLKWNKSGKVVYAGLTKRRGIEKDLFLESYCVKPTIQVTSKTATKEEIRWIQDKLKVTVDGIWGNITAAGVRAKRNKLGWEETSGFTCTVKLISALDK